MRMVGFEKGCEYPARAKFQSDLAMHASFLAYKCSELGRTRKFNGGADSQELLQLFIESFWSTTSCGYSGSLRYTKQVGSINMPGDPTHK
jgi:hypothetical protein